MRGRKGFIFSLVALVIIVIVVAGISYSGSRQQAMDAVLTQHILSADHFLEQLEQDFERALFITGYRSLLALEEHVSVRGEYISDFSVAFSSVMINGTIPYDDGGTTRYASYDIMTDTTLEVFQTKITEVADEYGMRIIINLTDVRAEHVSPWVLRVYSMVTVNASSRDPNTRWDYVVEVFGDFHIDSLRDPVYSIESSGALPNVIRRSVIEPPFVVGNDVSNLALLWESGAYIVDPGAPSFLQRFSGDFTANPDYGIASLVHVLSLGGEAPGYTERSVVDYLYYGPSAPPPSETWYVAGMSPAFRLDTDALVRYDAQGLEYGPVG